MPVAWTTTGKSWGAAPAAISPVNVVDVVGLDGAFVVPPERERAMSAPPRTAPPRRAPVSVADRAFFGTRSFSASAKAFPASGGNASPGGPRVGSIARARPKSPRAVWEAPESASEAAW
jgi:hypothetical protein